MERVLRGTDYPNLSALSLWNIERDDAINLFSSKICSISIFPYGIIHRKKIFSFFHYFDETIFTGTLKNRIRSFSIDMNTNEERRSRRTTSEAVFTHILSTFSNFRRLNLNPNALWHQHLSFDTLSPSVRSSTLLELHVCVFDFNDCLRLLDGRFRQLRIFDVKIDSLFASLSDVIDNEVYNHLMSISRLIERN